MPRESTMPPVMSGISLAIDSAGASGRKVAARNCFNSVSISTHIPFRGPRESSIIDFAPVSFHQYIGNDETIGQHVGSEQPSAVGADLGESKILAGAQANEGNDSSSSSGIVGRNRGGFDHLGMAQEGGLDLA